MQFDIFKFRDMKKNVKEVEKVKLAWTEKQKQLASLKLSKKETKAWVQEQRKLDILDELKEEGGPFACAEQVDEYLKCDKIPEEKKYWRMRNEVVFARDTCVSLPRKSPYFRIYDTSGKKRRLLTSAEFGENIKSYLGKKSGRSKVTLEEYRKAVAGVCVM